MALGLLGILVALVVLFFEPIIHAAGELLGVSLLRGFRRMDEVPFIRRDQTVLWMFLLCAQSALWAGLLVPLTTTVRALRPWRSRATAAWVALGLTLAVGVLVMPMAVKRLDYPLPGHQAKLAILTFFAMAVAYVGALGIWRAKRAADDALATEGYDDHAIARYLDLRDTLDRLLSYMGAIVSAAVLATGALRNAVITWSQTNAGAGAKAKAAEIFPPERVLLYGVFLSAVLALIYVPAYQRVRALGCTLRDRICPLLWPPHADWRTRSEERGALGTLLRLDMSPSTSLRAGVAILAPLASAIVSHALGAG